MTAREHFTEILNGMEDIVNNHPYHAFVLNAIFIEVLGKCLSSKDWQQGGDSTTDFTNALKEYPSLQKYQSVSDSYSILRCGMAHALLLKPGVVLVPDENDLFNGIIGCKDLYQDICQAWEDLKSGQVTSQKDLDADVMPVTGEASGTTISTNYKLLTI